MFLLLLSCLFATSQHASAALTPGDETPNTREFMELYEAMGPVDASPYKVLLVPGLATDVTEQIGRFTGHAHLTPTPGFLAAFYQQSAWMQKIGIDHEFVPINRSGSCDENGDLIAAAIARSSKPVILVSQSKGGVDILQGLIRHPEVCAHVAAWVAYQPPHDGSILADLVQNQTTLRGPTDLLLKALRGSALALVDMSTAFRANYNASHRSEIENLTREIPIVTLVTTEVPASLASYLFLDKSESAFLGPFIKPIADRDHGLNDGIASVHGTCLENTACVYLTGIDHFASVMNTAPYKTLSEPERVMLFKTMLQMAVHRAKSFSRE